MEGHAANFNAVPRSRNHAIYPALAITEADERFLAWYCGTP
jgi:hypothetical protein